MDSKLIVIAIGGNSLIEDSSHVTVDAQYKAAEKTAYHIAKLVADGHRVVIAHGNGPQVGYILFRAEYARKVLHSVPLDSCVADTQGAIGYQLQKALDNEFAKLGLRKEVATVVTQVEVDPADPSFGNPTKPIGSFMTEEDAMYHKENSGWSVVEDAGRGWRRVVASPKPKAIEMGFRPLPLEELLSTSDFISLHLPLTDETRNIMSREHIALMKTTAFLINTARGALVDEKALAEAIEEGRIAGAGVDVLNEEPPRHGSPLLAVDECCITPHIAWAAKETRSRLMQKAEENLAAFLSGNPINVVS